MKFNKIFLVAATLLLGLVACQDKVEWGKTPNNNGVTVYFQVPDETGLEVEPGTVTEHEIIVCRTDSAAALTLPIIVQENDGNVFDIPTEVTFEAGKSQAIIPISWPADLTVGEEYGLIITFDSTVVSQYQDIFYQFSITNVKYDFGKGVFVDGFWTGNAWYVDYKIANFANGSKQIVIMNPYAVPSGAGEAVADEYGVYDMNTDPLGVLEGDYQITIKVAPNGDAEILPTEVGLDYGGSLMAAMFFDFGYDDGYGKFSATDSAVVFDGNVGITDGEGLYYFDFSLYLSQASYIVTLKPPFVLEAEESDYEGAFLLTCVSDGVKEAYTEPITITSYNDSIYGQYYYITGMPDNAEMIGYFSTSTHAMEIYPGVLGEVEIGGAVFTSYLLTLIDGEEGIAADEKAKMQFAVNDDGTISLYKQSEALGYINYIENETDGTFINSGYTDFVLTPLHQNVAPMAPQHAPKQVMRGAKQRVKRTTF